MSVIHAFTEPTPERGTPAFISVNAKADGNLEITVRAYAMWPGSRQPAHIELTPEDAAAMALDILDYFNGLAQHRK